MPTMVMSHLPKMTGNNSVRKRQKTKIDNIVPISYMYVGTPKRKYTFYVRERLVYRSNVEVTYEDVYNYLANVANDESVSLHYSVNGLYVPITTTGQLHTFIRHVHNDPSVFLYVENQDYVWNVTPQNNTHKMEKRVRAGGAAPGDGASDPYDSIDDEEESQVEEGEDCCNVSEDEEYEDEDEEEYVDEPRIPPILTDHNAPFVFAEKVPVKEAFLEPKPRGVVTKKPQNVGTKLSLGLNRDNAESDRTLAPNKDAQEPGSGNVAAHGNKKWTVAEAYNQIQTMLSDALVNKTMGSVPEQISEQLVLNIWNPDFPHNDQVLKDTVSLLKNSIGTGILCYYHLVMLKFNPDDSEDDDTEAMGKILFTEYMPAHDPDLLAEFIDCALVAACNTLESVQHLARLQQEFDYFNQLNEKIENNKNDEQLPTLREIHDHLRASVTAAHYGFRVVNPFFPPGCECKKAIREVTLEFQKLNAAMDNFQQKSCSPQQIDETKRFMIESAKDVVERFTDKNCPQHKTIELTLRGSEVYKWRRNLNVGYEKWRQLRDAGENCNNLDLECFDIFIDKPPPYAIKPEEIVGDVPIAQGSSAKHAKSTPSTTATDNNQPSATTPEELETTLQSMSKMSTKCSLEEPKSDSVSSQPSTKPGGKETVTAKATTTSTNVSATTSSTGEAAGGATAVISKKMSAELQKLVDNMYKNVPAQHNYVYPPPPKPGAILIPTGGLARCRCSKNCPEFLMEPAYEYVERFNEPRQTVWEKTKQKRFKKN